MKEIIQFTGGTAEITVEIWRRPRQRHMNLTVRPDGRVRVTCNKRISKREIFAFVSQSREFIARRSQEREDTARRFPAKAVLSGEEWMFLGARRRLDVVWTWTKRIRVTVLENGELEMQAPVGASRSERLAALVQFYRRQGRLYLPERLGQLSVVMGVRPKAVAVRGQSSRWGSCSSSGTISLNWKLMAAPAAVIDYVIVHELAHLVHMNHSPRFWKLVGEFHKDYRAGLAWLKENEAELGRQFHE